MGPLVEYCIMYNLMIEDQAFPKPVGSGFG